MDAFVTVANVVPVSLVHFLQDQKMEVQLNMDLKLFPHGHLSIPPPVTHTVVVLSGCRRVRMYTGSFQPAFCVDVVEVALVSQLF